MRKIALVMFFSGLATMALLVFYGVACCLLIQAGIHISHHIPHWWMNSAYASFGLMVFGGIATLFMDFVDWYMKGINE